MSAAKKKKKNTKNTKKKQTQKVEKKNLEVKNEEEKKEEDLKKTQETSSEVPKKKKKKSQTKKENKTVENEKDKTSNKSQDSVQKDEDSAKETEKKNSGKKKSKSKEKEELSQEEKKPEEIKEEQVKEESEKEEKSNSEEKDKKNDIPKYVQEMLKNKKIKMYIFIAIVVLILLLVAFSTFFALFNLTNTNIVSGVSIKGIDVSKLSSEDAKNKINDATNKELIPEIILKYGEYTKSINAEQIEYKYKIDDAVKKAYDVGRDSGVVINNYSLIFTSLFGKNVKIEYTYNEDLLNQFIDGVSAEIPGVVVEPSYYIEEAKLIINRGTDGIQVKKDELKKQILEKIYKREFENITDEYKQEIDIPTEQAKASNIDMDKIYSEIHTEPKDAYFEMNPYKIYPEVDGVDLKVSVEEAKNIISSEEKQEYSLDLNITKPAKTINDLGTEAFPYLVSSFSTRYDASNTNRSTNLAIAANKINGKVLMPGEEFSYNQVVGKRTVEEGYRDAAIYQDGKVVDGLAGGICQISSTLYNAVLLANLEVTERMNHSYTTSYVAAGRDATVVWGTKDFKFRNSRTYPIKIEASVKNGVAEFKIHGVQEEKEYEIRILPVTTGSIPYSTSYVQDPTLAPGQQIVSQAGHSGLKVTTYKEVRYNGEVISKDIISNDTYKPMQTVIRVGPAVPVQ